MKKYLNCFWLAALFFLFSADLAFGQTKGLNEVTVNIQSGTFTTSTGLPFDVPFKITGSVNGSTRRIEMRYRVKPGNFKFWMRDVCAKNCKATDGKCDCKDVCTCKDDPNGGPCRDDCWSNPVTWNNFEDPSKDQVFYLPCGAIYPNVLYEFSFKVYRTPSINATQVAALNKTIFDLIDAFATHNAAGATGILDGQINTALKQAAGPGQGVTNVDGSVFQPKVTDPDLAPVTAKLIQAAALIDNSKIQISTYKSSYKDYNKAALKAALIALLVNPAGLNAPSKALWNGPIAANITDFKTLKYSDIAALLTNPAIDITGIFNGDKKINSIGNALESATAFDPASVQLLFNFYSSLGQFKQTDGNTAYFNAGLVTDATKLNLRLSGVLDEQDKLATQSAIKDKALAAMPDLITNKYLSMSYIITDEPAMDVTSENNAYIGLDYGIVYAANYNQLFLYEGVNFYFTPVNKDAPLATIHGFWRNVGKRVSIHLGVTQDLIDNPDTRYQSLIKGAGSILLGVGVRFNRIMRVNFGPLFFYENDTNPLVDHKSLQVRPAFSLTFDLNVAKALGGLGRTLGVPQ